MTDYIPALDDEYDTYATVQFIPYALKNTAPLGLTTPEEALSSAVTARVYSWNGFQNAQAAFRAATDDRDVKRGALTTLMRNISNKVQANPAITDAQKAGLGITVREATKTPVAMPTTNPFPTASGWEHAGDPAPLHRGCVDARQPRQTAGGAELRNPRADWGTAPVDPESMS